MKKGQVIINIILIFILGSSIISCNNNEQKNITKKVKSEVINEKTNYYEKVNPLDSNIISHVYDMKYINDKLVMLGLNNDFSQINCYEYDEATETLSIDEKYKLPKAENGKKLDVNCASISDSGDVFVSYQIVNENAQSSNNYINRIFSKENENTIDVNVKNKENELYQLEYLKDGNLLYTNRNNNTYIYIDSATGNEKFQYDTSKIKNERMIDFCSDNKYFYYFTDSNMRIYDINNQKVKECTKDMYEKLDFKEMDYVRFFKSKKEDNIFLCSNKGVSKYSIEKNTSSQVINQLGTSFSLGDAQLLFFEEVNNDKYVALFITKDMKYFIAEFSKEKKKDPKAITIYSLYENKIIENAIGKYKAIDNNITINYEVGINDKSITRSDAIKTLNAKLNSNDAPDILILDGLDQKRYVEKGLLKDCSSLVNELKNNEEFFESILGGYEQNNHIYRIPLKFKIPIIMGNGIEDINSIEELNQYINNNKGVIAFKDVDSSEKLISYLYSYYNKKIIAEDGNVNKENLEEFLTTVKSIYNKGNKNNDTKEEDNINDYLTNPCSGFSFLVSGRKVEIGYLSSLTNYSCVKTISKMKNVNDRILINDNINYFIPEEVVSISSKSNHSGEAENILRYLLSSNFLIDNNSNGLPINKTLFMKEFNSLSNPVYDAVNYGGKDSITIPRISKEDVDNLANSIDKVKNENLIDIEQVQIIMNTGCKYVEGNKSLNEAIKEISNKIDIRNSEK